MIIPVAVEKLARQEFAEIASCQEALQTIFPRRIDIFYHPFSEVFQKTRVFQQPPLFATVILKVLSHIGKYLREEGLGDTQFSKLAGCTALLALDSVEPNASSRLFLTLSHSRTRRRFVWLPVFFNFENAILPQRG